MDNLWSIIDYSVLISATEKSLIENMSGHQTHGFTLNRKYNRNLMKPEILIKTF